MEDKEMMERKKRGVGYKRGKEKEKIEDTNRKAGKRQSCNIL